MPPNEQKKNFSLIFHRKKCKSNAETYLDRINKVECTFNDDAYAPEHINSMKKATITSMEGVKQTIPIFYIPNVIPIPNMCAWVSYLHFSHHFNVIILYSFTGSSTTKLYGGR